MGKEMQENLTDRAKEKLDTDRSEEVTERKVDLIKKYD